MYPIIVRNRMTRDEMCAQFPEGYLLIVEKDPDFRNDDVESGKATAFLVGVFDDDMEAARYQNEDVERAESICIVKAEHFTEEAFAVEYLLAHG